MKIIESSTCRIQYRDFHVQTDSSRIIYLLKQSHTQKNFTCLISIIRSHLNQYIYSQVPVNANIFFTSTALLHSDKCDRYACLNVFLLTLICQGWTSREMDISLSVRIPLVYIASVWIFPQVYQWVFIFFLSFFSLTDMQDITPWLLINWSTCQKKMADPMISFIN